MAHAFDELSELLSASKLRPQIIPGRIARPFFHDAIYNFSVISCATQELGTPQKQDEQVWQINSSILKFSHFLAVRPTLLKDFRIWHEHRTQRAVLDLENWPLLPRGFLTDDTQAASVTFLVTTGALQRAGKNIVLKATKQNPLIQLLRAVEKNNLFQSERDVIRKLQELRITQSMLGVG
ncbi:hypothetical protein [Corallococcus exercitus]|uniref:hypothetical protein n=1 Tax=Corallococcus exercitus TaxID=2316736 RepID=UPI0035D4FE99